MIGHALANDLAQAIKENCNMLNQECQKLENILNEQIFSKDCTIRIKKLQNKIIKTLAVFYDINTLKVLGMECQAEAQIFKTFIKNLNTSVATMHDLIDGWISIDNNELYLQKNEIQTLQQEINYHLLALAHLLHPLAYNKPTPPETFNLNNYIKQDEEPTANTKLTETTPLQTNTPLTSTTDKKRSRSDHTPNEAKNKNDKVYKKIKSDKAVLTSPPPKTSTSFLSSLHMASDLLKNLSIKEGFGQN